MQFFSTIAALIACASAYKISTPTANSTIAKGSTVNIQFSTVDTDASTFSVYLVNFATNHFPPTVLSLAQDVAQNAGSVNVRIPCSVSSDAGYQLNFINGTNTYVIYAQSPLFTLTGNCVDPTTSASGAYSNSSVSSVSIYQTIIYENPVVWFVQPSNLVAAAAICPPSSQQTVTVQAGPAVQTVVQTVTVQAGPAVQTVTETKTVASCPSQDAIVSALAKCQGGGGAGAGPVAPVPTASASASIRASASGSASVAALPTYNRTPGTSGAVKTGSAVAALMGAFVVLLL